MLLAHREQNPMWYHNDYTYNWGVDLGDHVKPGRNTLQCPNVVTLQEPVDWCSRRSATEQARIKWKR